MENSVRPVEVGRKGCLFCSNYDTAEDASVYYSFMDCCKLVDIDPKKWMSYFLAHVHDYDTDYCLDLTELLPAHLKAKGLRHLQKSWRLLLEF